MKAIGLVSGTGDLGTALAVHLAKRGKVLLGSRVLERAKLAVEAILSEKQNIELLSRNLIPTDNVRVVSECDIAILTVPYDSSLETVQSLRNSFRGNQVLISTAAKVEKIDNEYLARGIDHESLSQKIEKLLPENIKVAAAFQTIPANRLYREMPFSADVLVSSNSRETFDRVSDIIKSIEGLRPLYLGSLALSGEVERLTALLLNVGINNGLKSPTLKFNSF